MSIDRRIYEGVPAPGGCYSHAVIHGGLVYCAGQVGTDPATREFRTGIEDQTRQALHNLSTVLEKAGSSMASVLQARVFLREFDDFKAMDAIFTEVLGDHRPARTTIPCPGFPEQLKVEIDVIAALESKIRS